jgi:hypothetical protein
MKKLILLLSIALIGSVTLIAQDSKKILGTWKMKAVIMEGVELDLKAMEKIEQELKDSMAAGDTEEFEFGMKVMQTFKLTFLPKNKLTFTAFLPDENKVSTIKGTYTLNEKAKKIICNLVDEDNEIQKMSISYKWRGNNLLAELQTDDDDEIQKWILEKVKK